MCLILQKVTSFIIFREIAHLSSNDSKLELLTYGSGMYKYRP